MLEFPAASVGVQAAIALLKESVSGARPLPQIRIGLHLGEVMVEENGDLLGHGVNVAARLQALAEPGSAMVSEAVRSQVRTTVGLPFTAQGRVQLDKMSEKIAVYALNPDPRAWMSKISRRRVARGLLITGVIVAPLAAFATWRLWSPQTNADGAPALAALPFATLTDQVNDIAFAAGLHEDLLTRLSRISALRVIARTSVLGYAGTTKRASEIARELGVDAVLEGSVQRSGDRVRIAVQLIDPDTDSQTWGETYDRALTADNLFEIQREITEAIADALNTVLTAREMTAAFTGGTHRLEAYEAYARGRLLLARMDYTQAEQMRELIAAFDLAIAFDPNFASAYAQKAYALSCFYWFGQFRQGFDPALRDAARVALDRADALAPDAADTQVAHAAYSYWGFLDYQQALRHLSRALQLAPNDADILLLRAFVNRRMGQFDKSSAAFERAILLDPQNAQTMGEFADLLGAKGEFAHADALIDRARTIDPGSPNLRNLASWLQFRRGDAGGAWAEYRELRSVLPYNRLFFAICTREEVNINFALHDWPTELRRPASFPDLYEIARARALLALAQPNEAHRILLRVKARLDASARPYPDGWYYVVSPCVVAGLLGDLVGVQAAERDFLTTAPRDEFAKYEIYASLADSFLHAGDHDRAIYYLEEAAKIFGPSYYLRAAIDPSFDALRDHRGYRALERRYQTWAARQH